ncbi:SDR family NAD(P)-dependent oxidoreductase [Nocardioides marmotae]|uniref:SDR family NAD(P)-dependent oxidoreductase n=1 Tax=Nocardioides marmotae TaxID=2663857 RepID=UPI0012B58BAE|nr:SDR family NAD(P)-dependent oxidoreductase [Nocardioides marmotae]MBC9734303.1 SDR family NAD(P)-dependent oxidoreductase [Nocardioides marmotae]MTB85404.1 SDR family NAD(P)-dependent oxidoreductase [Nocardioides marmotae]
MRVADGVALVAGGGSGLGRATAIRLAEAGAGVVVLDLPGSEGPEVAERLGDRARFVAADVCDEAQVQAAVDAATGLGDLTMVVNCAGIGAARRVVGRHGPFPLDEFERVLRVNLVGTFNVLRLAAAAMVARPTDAEERGVVVNTASAAAFDGQVGQAAYSASKAGLVGMTLPVARDLASQRIRVNTIAPGFFRTPLVDLQPAEVQASLVSQVPHPARAGDPAEFAALVQHIIENPMLNGETIRLDAAMRMSAR